MSLEGQRSVTVLDDRRRRHKTVDADNTETAHPTVASDVNDT